jgi:DNA-binding beta-propeller fold protein YncE
VDELIRGSMHDALDAEPPPAGLRARVIASVQMHDRTERRPHRPRFQRAGQFAAGFVAGLLAVAVVAGLMYSRQAISLPSPGRGSHPAPPASLISPEGIAVAPDGTVYVSDHDGNRVFRLLPAGGLVSVAGGGVGADGPANKANLWGPNALDFDRQGNLFVATTPGGAVRRIDRQGFISTVTTVYGPQGLAFDSAGRLYVGTYFGVLRRIDARGESTDLDLSRLPSPTPQFGNMAFDATGNLYVTDRAPTTGLTPSPGGGCRVIRLNITQTPVEGTVVAGTGTCGFSGDGGRAASAELNDPSGIVFDANGNLYLADAGNHRIRRVDKNGIITTVAGTGVAGYSGDGGPATKAQLTYPLGLAISSGGLIYVADPNADPTTTPARVRAFRISDGTITTVAGG